MYDKHYEKELIVQYLERRKRYKIEGTCLKYYYEIVVVPEHIYRKPVYSNQPTKIVVQISSLSKNKIHGTVYQKRVRHYKGDIPHKGNFHKKLH